MEKMMKMIWYGILIAIIAVSFYVSTDAGIASVCAVVVTALYRWCQERLSARRLDAGRSE